MLTDSSGGTTAASIRAVGMTQEEIDENNIRELMRKIQVVEGVGNSEDVDKALLGAVVSSIGACGGAGTAAARNANITSFILGGLLTYGTSSHSQ